MIDFGEEKKKSNHYALKVIVLLQILVIIGIVTAFTLYYVFHKPLLPTRWFDNELTQNASNAKITAPNSVDGCGAVTDDGQCLDEGQVLVQTKLGDVYGFRKAIFNTSVEVFLGIPYAIPPVGNLRFRRAVPIKPWKTAIKATQYSYDCIQSAENRIERLLYVPHLYNVSEDCLYLNVWTPRANADVKKPVMVWIHGGAFAHGTANVQEHNGELLSTFGDVVVVNFNYRLGPLGFLDLGIKEAPGNQGLYDQILAIRWVSENIEAFGGDPDQITLFGVGSGALSVGIHMVSPDSKTLFRRAILQSGSPMILSSFYLNAGKIAYKVAEKLDCLTSDSEDLDYDADNVLRCLRSLSAKDYINVQGKLEQKTNYAVSPVAYGDFLRLLPREFVKNDSILDEFFHTEDVLLGVTKDEASFYLNQYDPKLFPLSSKTVKNITKIEDTVRIFDDLTAKAGILDEQIKRVAKRQLIKNDETLNVDPVRLLYDAFGDMIFNCPSLLMAKVLTRAHKNVYFYLFNHKSSGFSNIPKWMGVPHASLTPFVFGTPLTQPLRFNGNDIEVSKRVMKSWSEFAGTGKPANILKLEWRKFTLDKQQYMEILSRGVKVKRKYHENTCSAYQFTVDGSS